jgi:DegV family protein with EDD domain
MTVGVVSDSASNIPADLRERYDIAVVPMILKFGERIYRDGVDLPPGDFYDMLAKQHVAASTSGPSAGDFREAFARELERKDALVCVTVASVVSVTFASATLAAAEFDGRVRVVDSRSASLAEGFVALEAARAADEGRSLDEIEARAAWVADRAVLVATISTFEFLRRSGRVNAVKAFAATTLNVKPVFALRRGSVDQLARPRSRAHALDRLMEEVRLVAEAGPLHAGVVHAAAEDEAQAIAARLRRELDPVECLTAEFTPLMGAHTGPGLVGIACWA